MSKNILLVMALPSESQELFEKNNVEPLYTGVGKVNAAYALTKKITEIKADGGKIDLVVNLGTSGSKKFKKGELVECTSFVQRDMDTRAFGYELGKTPAEDEIPLYLDTPKRFDNLRTGICGTGDSFATEAPEIKCDVFEMEAYALAKVCRNENIEFSAVKYISDGADDEAAEDWEDCLDDNSKKLFKFYKEYVEKL